jgi:two-component system KDP operon response regulator KdpE
MEAGAGEQRREGVTVADVPATRVLVVEDDPEVVDVLRRLLTAHGYQVYYAPHAMAAFHMLVTPEEAQPHVLILDIGLPGINGVAVLEFIRLRLRSDLPVVVLTGVATAEQEERLRELGVSALLRKPTSASALMSALAKAAGRDSSLQLGKGGVCRETGLSADQIAPM